MATESTTTGHVIVCGLSTLGVRIVEQLYLSGAQAVVLAEDSGRGLPSALTNWGVRYVAGSGRHAHCLIEADIATAAALICVEENDLNALETVLAARDLRPDLRVVVQMANAGVGRAVTEITGPGTVLDVATLAAPSIVDVCTKTEVHELSLGGRQFVIVDRPAVKAGSLRTLFGDLAPIAVVSSSGVQICPGRDTVVNEGDRVTVIATPSEMEMVGLPSHVDDARLALGVRLYEWLRRVVRSTWALADRPLKINLLALVVLVLVSAGVLRLVYHPTPGTHLTLISAVYFTVETVATVGYGDFSYGGQSQSLQVFATVLIIIGVTLVTSGFALVTNLMFSRRISEAFGQQRVTQMEGHTVVIGLGDVGVRVVRALHASGHGAVVIERDEDNRHRGQAEALGVPIIRGDATIPETLQAANVGTAAAVAVLTSNDLTNLETGLAIRDYLGPRRNDVPLVLRIFDRTLGRRIGENFAFREVRSTSALAAPWFVGAALGLQVLSTFYVERELLMVARLTVAPSGGLAGVAMRELSANIRVVALSRAANHGDLEHPPRRDTKFAPGDQAYLIGPYDDLLVVLRRDAAGVGVAAS
jgi:Trk K+ transport system NAD-binding subunit